MATITYRIDAWCVANDKTKAETMFQRIITELRNKKLDGTITGGNVTRNEVIAPDSYSEGV